ncbi:MAG TPA: hypothetical protein VGQ09_04250 [Chitinophagaceae bacterium]|jgi:hypothetical protein|nr:hypothetical protein [Chitinophagaceae bacterium]
MKKIFFLGLILTLFAAAASAQQTNGNHFRHQRETRSLHRGELNRYELRRLHQDNLRYKIARRRAHRDGIVTHFERRRLNKMRKHERRELYRLRHNNHHRVI